ncbi:hypothetical protein BDZ97DRAFT_161770 [Flammula alnicola]|nr:hypothetical protein BDZ97DRAFT_161770 [Flammula alnicola]
MVLSDPVQDLPVMQGLSSDYSIVSVEDIQPHILAANSGESSYAERYTEFIQPTKGQTTSTDRELSEPAQEIIMIDLTHDDSPLSARKARKVSKNPTLPILKTPSLVAPTEHERVPQGRSDIALTFSTALPDEDKTLSSWSPKKPKIERISSPTPPVVQEPDAKQPSVRFRQNPKLPMTGIEKITSPLQQVEGNRKERLVVNFTLPHLGPSQQASNKIHLHATMSPKTVGMYTSLLVTLELLIFLL